MASPNDTIKLLEKLRQLGFDDLAFSHLHHWRAVGRIDSIAAHITYCERINEFEPGGNNERVQQRLELVLGAYVGGSLRSRRQETFVALAETAWHEIPHPDGARVEVAA